MNDSDKERIEFCVIDNNRWTGKRTIYPIIFSEEEAKKHISSQPTDNKTFEIFILAKQSRITELEEENKRLRELLSKTE